MTPAGANAGRVRARRCAVQALYQWQMAGHKPSDILKEFVAERELVKVDLDYFATLTSEIPKRIELLQGDIATAIDREWLKIGPVERSVILIEWGEKFERFKREADAEIVLERRGENDRRIVLRIP